MWCVPDLIASRLELTSLPLCSRCQGLRTGVRGPLRPPRLLPYAPHLNFLSRAARLTLFPFSQKTANRLLSRCEPWCIYPSVDTLCRKRNDKSSPSTSTNVCVRGGMRCHGRGVPRKEVRDGVCGFCGASGTSEGVWVCWRGGGRRLSAEQGVGRPRVSSSPWRLPVPRMLCNLWGCDWGVEEVHGSRMRPPQLSAQ